MSKVYTLWKEKGEYPVDEEGILHVSTYWKRALRLKEKKEQKKIYFADIFIIVCILSFFSLICKGIF